MPRKLRRKNLIVIVGGLGVLAAIVIAANTGSVPAMRCDVRTASGLPISSIFEGVTGSNVDVAIVNKLVAEAKAPPRDPCHKKTKSAWSMFLDAFARLSFLHKAAALQPAPAITIAFGMWAGIARRLPFVGMVSFTGMVAKAPNFRVTVVAPRADKRLV